MSGRWFFETLHPSVRLGLKVRRTIFKGRSRFQRIEICHTEAFGRMLVLDGIIQTTEKDEWVYHEMLTHVGLLSLEHPQRVLIIGGGDGGILREVLRHPVRSVTIVEIDEEVIKLSRRYLGSICQRAFEDQRVKLIIEDGLRFARWAEEQFDVIIIDSPDPIGPAKSLFSTECYRALARLLHIPGVLMRQTGSICLQANEQPQAYQRLRQFFPHVAPYLAAVPTYIAGFFSFMFASNEIHPTSLDLGELEGRYLARQLVTRYYTPKIHLASFALPHELEQRISAGTIPAMLVAEPQEV